MSSCSVDDASVAEHDVQSAENVESAFSAALTWPWSRASAVTATIWLPASLTRRSVSARSPGVDISRGTVPICPHRSNPMIFTPSRAGEQRVTALASGYPGMKRLPRRALSPRLPSLPSPVTHPVHIPCGYTPRVILASDPQASAAAFRRLFSGTPVRDFAPPVVNSVGGTCRPLSRLAARVQGRNMAPPTLPTQIASAGEASHA